MNKIILLNFFVLCVFYGFGQTTMVNDFESGSDGLLPNVGSITSTVVANPNKSGINTTANCLEITRSSGTQWWIIAGINVNPDMAISASETKYLSMMVHFPAQPDLGIRFDATDDTSNGNEAVRALNSYTNYNEWQEIVFEIKNDDVSATSFTLGTLFRLSFHPDMGFQNNPVGLVLDTPGKKGYIDQIKILDSNPLSTSDFELSKNISLYTNPVKSHFRLQTKNGIQISNVGVYNVLGAKVAVYPVLGSNKYDISNLASGIYLVKISDDKGAVTTKRLLKQ